MRSGGRFSGNTAFGIVGVCLFVASMLVGHFASKQDHQRATLSIGLVGFGLAWLSVAVGQLFTGYSWRNLADRNEGERRDENPKQFWRSVVLDFAVFVAACGLAAFKYFAK